MQKTIKQNKNINNKVIFIMRLKEGINKNEINITNKVIYVIKKDNSS